MKVRKREKKSRNNGQSQVASDALSSGLAGHAELSVSPLQARRLPGRLWQRPHQRLASLRVTGRTTPYNQRRNL